MNVATLRAAVLLTLTACTTRPVPAVAPAPLAPSDTSSVITLAVPERVAAFKMQTRRDYDDPALGVQLRYQGPDSVSADVFVYPGPDLGAACPLACAQRYLDDEIAQFRRSIPELLRRGYFQQVNITLSEPLVPNGATPLQLGHHLAMAVTRDGRDQRSELYLYYLPGYRVKVRATFVESEPHWRDVRAFLDALVPVLTGRGAPPT
jgi:hypothetical protein